MDWQHPLLLVFAASLFPTTVGILSIWKSWRHGKQVQEMRVEINGRMEKLLKTTKAAAFSEGELSGAKHEQDRQHVIDNPGG